MKKKNYSILLILVSSLIFFSCSKDEILGESTELEDALQSRALSLADAEEILGDSISAILVDPDSIKSKLLPENKIMSRAYSSYDDYDEYFSSNMWAIRELNVTIRARSASNYSANTYWSTNGKSKEISLVSSVTSDAQKFYIKVLPATSGIPYLIYSRKENTPVGVGQYNSNPSNKVLYTYPNDQGSMYSAGWDLIQSGYGYEGYYGIQSQSYLGQSDPNNMWSVYYHVLQAVNGDKLGYAQYNKSAQQEFLIQPDAVFTIAGIEWDKASASVEEVPRKFFIKKEDVNNNDYRTNIKGKATGTFKETDRFTKKNTVKVKTNGNYCFRPTAKAKRVLDTYEGIVYYNPTSLNQSYSKGVSIDYEVSNVPKRTLVETIFYINAYKIKMNYKAYATMNDRKVTFTGAWEGYVLQDPKDVVPEKVNRYFSLITGEEIYQTRSLANQIETRIINAELK